MTKKEYKRVQRKAKKAGLTFTDLLTLQAVYKTEKNYSFR